jgi:hypothetical protein
MTAPVDLEVTVREELEVAMGRPHPLYGTALPPGGVRAVRRQLAALRARRQAAALPLIDACVRAAYEHASLAWALAGTDDEPPLATWHYQEAWAALSFAGLTLASWEAAGRPGLATPTSPRPPRRLD